MALWKRTDCIAISSVSNGKDWLQRRSVLTLSSSGRSHAGSAHWLIHEYAYALGHTDVGAAWTLSHQQRPLSRRMDAFRDDDTNGTLHRPSSRSSAIGPSSARKREHDSTNSVVVDATHGSAVLSHSWSTLGNLWNWRLPSTRTTKLEYDDPATRRVHRPLHHLGSANLGQRRVDDCE